MPIVTKPFSDLPQGAQFHFAGETYSKDGLNIATSEGPNGRSVTFKGETDVKVNTTQPSTGGSAPVKANRRMAIFDRDTYSSLAEASEQGARYFCDVVGLTGELAGDGSLSAAMTIVNTALDCVGGTNLIFVLVDSQGKLIDVT